MDIPIESKMPNSKLQSKHDKNEMNHTTKSMGFTRFITFNSGNSIMFNTDLRVGIRQHPHVRGARQNQIEDQTAPACTRRTAESDAGNPQVREP
jgi:hypothetical protein